MTPLDISKKDLAIIREQLIAQCQLNQTATLECFEWGAGGSTVEFPKVTLPYARFRWMSIEHSREWKNKVQAELEREGLSKFVQVILEPCEGNPFEQPMDDYVEWPFRFEKRFNFIFVDGRKRRRCLLVASKLLARGGVVILHDAQREWYHSAFRAFANHSRVGDMLWIGRINGDAVCSRQ